MVRTFLNSRRNYNASVLIIFLLSFWAAVGVYQRAIYPESEISTQEEAKSTAVRLKSDNKANDLVSLNQNKKVIVFPFEEVLAAPGFIKQDNELLLQEIREKYLIGPSQNDYVLVELDVTPTWQETTAKTLLGNKKKGFFIECGANNGEYLSNTLSLEVNDDWSGLLVEADPQLYSNLLKKNRKAWSLNACLSPNPYPQKVSFHPADALGKIIEGKPSVKGSKDITVQCFPLFSILLAINRTQIDFFSLDVEGVELDVLKTIPWKDVQISTLAVEFNHLPEGKMALKKYMEEVGYVMHTDGETVKEAQVQNVDYIFYHPKYVRNIKQWNVQFT